jgi:hypothetical protein
LFIVVFSGVAGIIIIVQPDLVNVVPRGEELLLALLLPPLFCLFYL